MKRNQTRAIAQVRCGIVRECGNTKCIFKAVTVGYKTSPVGEIEKNRNLAIEKSIGPLYYPDFSSIGKGDFSDIMCKDFVER